MRLKIKLKSSSNSKDIKKFSNPIKEDEMINYIYSYIENSSFLDSNIVIKDISMSTAKQNELWFQEIDLSISLRVSSEEAMINFLNFILSKDSKYSFFINNFTYPNDDRDWSFNVSIPLKVFYK